MLRATCSADAHRCRPDSNNTKDTRVFVGSRRTTCRYQKKRVFTSKTATHVQRSMHPSQTRETAFNKDEGKHGQREILESREIRQVPTKRRVEVQSQNRHLLIRDVCTCLAQRGAKVVTAKFEGVPEQLGICLLLAGVFLALDRAFVKTFVRAPVSSVAESHHWDPQHEHTGRAMNQLSSTHRTGQNKDKTRETSTNKDQKIPQETRYSRTRATLTVHGTNRSCFMLSAVFFTNLWRIGSCSVLLGTALSTIYLLRHRHRSKPRVTRLNHEPTCALIFPDVDCLRCCERGRCSHTDVHVDVHVVVIMHA